MPIDALINDESGRNTVRPKVVRKKRGNLLVWENRHPKRALVIFYEAIVADPADPKKTPLQFIIIPGDPLFKDPGQLTVEVVGKPKSDGTGYKYAVFFLSGNHDRAVGELLAHVKLDSKVREPDCAPVFRMQSANDPEIIIES